LPLKWGCATPAEREQVVFSYPKEIDKQKDKKPTLVGFLLPEIFIRFITPLAGVMN
jgi:hypothetical protein